MSFDWERRDVLKLAVLFAAVVIIDRGHAMDAAPRPGPGNAGADNGKNASNGEDGQNAWAVSGASNFRAIYSNPELKAAFLLFLQNVYHIYPEDRFHKLIEQVSLAHDSDKEIYQHAQARLGEIKPFLSEIRLALPALSRQKAEMERQTLELVGSRRKIDGYLEMGTTGRYIRRLKSQLDLTGDIVLLHASPASYSPTDIVERGGLRKIGRFVSLQDYMPVSSSDVGDDSLDLVTNFIGFHHSPPARRDDFVNSLRRVLRRGGRLIVRDHDVNSRSLNHLVALAHDVFNMGLGAPWSANQSEIRNFTSLAELVRYIEKFGFKHDERTLLQAGDPTRNALMVFTKV